MTDRIRLDDLTDDALDALHIRLWNAEDASKAWERKADEQHARATQAEAAIERVRAEADRIEAAVRDNPTSPDLTGGYLACLRHIRAALDGPTG